MSPPSIMLVTEGGLGHTCLSLAGAHGGGRKGTKGNGNGPLSPPPPPPWTGLGESKVAQGLAQARFLLLYKAPTRSSALKELRADRCSQHQAVPARKESSGSPECLDRGLGMGWVPSSRKGAGLEAEPGLGVGCFPSPPSWTAGARASGPLGKSWGPPGSTFCGHYRLWHWGSWCDLGIRAGPGSASF